MDRRHCCQFTVWSLLVASVGCVNLNQRSAPESLAGNSSSVQRASAIPQNVAAMGARGAQQAAKAGSGITSAMRKMLPKRETDYPEQVIADDDPTRLGNPTAPIGADLHIAAAKLAEKNGSLENAMGQYRSALQVDSKNRSALIGLARLQHRVGDMSGAIRTYRNALNVYRNDPVIMNDLGLCYARNGQIDQAISVLRSATQAAPDRPMYRNNLAATLIEANRANEAVAYLTQTYGPGIAHYNVGYLLSQSGRADEAKAYLEQALQIDPTLQQARLMLAHETASAETASRNPLQVSESFSQGESPSYDPTMNQARRVRSPADLETSAVRPQFTPPAIQSPAIQSPNGSLRSEGEYPAVAPSAPPSHLRQTPARFGPFGYVADEGHAALVSYDEPTPMEEEVDATWIEPIAEPTRSLRPLAMPKRIETRPVPPSPYEVP